MSVTAVPLRVERERMHGVGPFVKADEQAALQRARQRVLAAAVGAGSVDALQIEDQVGGIEIRLGLNAHGVFRNFPGIDAGGRIAAHEHVLLARGIGMAVVAALDDPHEIFIREDRPQRRHAGTTRRIGPARAVVLVHAAVEAPVRVPAEAIHLAKAGGVELQRCGLRLRIVIDRRRRLHVERQAAAVEVRVADVGDHDRRAQGRLGSDRIVAQAVHAADGDVQPLVGTERAAVERMPPRRQADDVGSFLRDSTLPGRRDDNPGDDPAERSGID